MTRLSSGAITGPMDGMGDIKLSNREKSKPNAKKIGKKYQKNPLTHKELQASYSDEDSDEACAKMIANRTVGKVPNEHDAESARYIFKQTIWARPTSSFRDFEGGQAKNQRNNSVTHC